jgi:secreted trypsin-like serine protease
MIGENVRQAQEAEFPFVVSIVRINSDDSTQVSRFCTGTIVSSNDVLTVEHCLLNEIISNIQIISGAIDFRRGQRHNVEWWISYNQWAEQTNTPLEITLNDIAIVRVNIYYFFLIQ